MNELLDRIKLTDLLDCIGIISITLSAVVATAESVDLGLPPIALFIVLMLIVALREIERRLQKRLASEPSQEQQNIIKRLQAENEQLRAERDTVTVASQQWLSEPVALDGEKDE